MTAYLYQVRYQHINGHTYDHKGGEYMPRSTAYQERRRLEDNPDIVGAWVDRTDQFILYGPPPPDGYQPASDAAPEPGKLASRERGRVRQDIEG